MRKTNLREIKVKTVVKPGPSAKPPPQRIATHPDQHSLADTVVSVEKYLNQFKSEKSQSRSQRSNDSHSSTHQRPGTLTYESFTNRYYNGSSLLKKVGDANANRGPEFPVQAFKINVTASQHQQRQETNRSVDRLEKTTTIENAVNNGVTMNRIVTALDRFDQQSSTCGFEEYIERVARLNDTLSSLNQEFQGRSQAKSIVDRFKHLLNSLSRKCLIRLSQREDEFEAATEQNTRITSDLVVEQMKQRYEKKIQRLVQVIQEKEQKEHEVNKLLYCLRRNGVDIEGIVARSQKDEKKHKKCRTEYH